MSATTTHEGYSSFSAWQKCHHYKVVALVPACNEEKSIERTLLSLLGQTYPFEYILVIANNCVDNTVSIVKRLQEEYGAGYLRLEVMAENHHKKSGALNHGYNMLEPDVDFVFGMDADTIIDKKLVENGVRQFCHERYTAGICSAYRTLPLGPGATHWQRFLWRLQNIEFGLANAWRVENLKNARVLPGVSVIFRYGVLKRVAELQNGIVWAVDSLVEDYRLTLVIKDLGWRAKSSFEMISWSDVPLKIRGKGGLFQQRQRWYSGTVDELRLRGLKKHSRYELFTIVLLMFNLLMRFALFGGYITLAVEGVPIKWVSVFLILPVICIVSQLYRLLRYADQLDKWQVIITATLIVNEAYACWRECVYAYGIYESFANPDRGW
jgi:cellulose synthase/poly-beta-1,6-N-acetylglucosamine synthase-like glycosyltransferase